MTDPDQVPTLPAADSPTDSLTEPRLEAPGPALPIAATPGPPAEGDPGTDDVRPADAVSGQPVEAGGAPEPIPGAGVRYAVLRLLLLVTVGGLLALVGMRGWALLFVAVLVSGILSFFVFVRQREAAARNLEAAAAARAARHQPHAQGERPAA
jgi:Protein of unknown function (DUF4229)